MQTPGSPTLHGGIGSISFELSWIRSTKPSIALKTRQKEEDSHSHTKKNPKKKSHAVPSLPTEFRDGCKELHLTHTHSHITL